MFENSLRIVAECGLTFLHVFPFSARPGTPASRMPQLPKPIIQDRARALRDRGRERLDAFLEAEIGALRSILIETPSMGRTEHFASVRFAQRMSAGAIVRAKVTGRGSDHLEASLAA
jgi:threonylcarbamoyladenosine tRNA methylthiotransferase MtaB